MLRGVVVVAACALLTLAGCAQSAGAIDFVDDASTPTAAPATVVPRTPPPSSAAPSSTVVPPTALPPRAVPSPAVVPPTAVRPTVVPSPTVVPPTAVSSATALPPVASGPPGPNSLVYQGFWSGSAPGDLIMAGWRFGDGWLPANGVLANSGTHDGPTFASPYLGSNNPNAASLVRTGNYAVEAQIAVTPNAAGAFGVFLRRGTADWRAGVASSSRAFILGEPMLPNETPASLLLARTLAATDFAPDSRWVTYRFEARDSHFTFSADGGKLLR